MSRLKVLSTEGKFVAFDDLMIYQLEEQFDERVIFPWHNKYETKINKLCESHEHNPTAIVECEDQNEIEYTKNFAKKLKIEYQIMDSSSDIKDHTILIQKP